MPFGRLSLLGPDLRNELFGAPPDRLRRIAVAVAALAVESMPDHPVALDDAVAELRSGRLDPATASVVTALAVQLDQRYFELVDQEAPGELDAFHVARAASALAFAFSPDPESAAGESVYEAVAALDPNIGAVLAVVRRTE